jgi:two-component system, cell cycle sensor histidine kinase and response regulator CckA
MDNFSAKKNRRILIIDDNRAIHDDFRKILSPGTVTAAALDATEAALFGKSANVVQKLQYEIDSAYQGHEGVMLVKQALEAGRPYALALVDIRMPPGMDGVETTQKIWAVDPEIQIVICTAYADYSWDEMFEKIGNHDGLVILKKPFDTVEALQLAHALTEKWWLHQQSRRKMEELESMVAERTTALAKTNEALQIENTERKKTEEILRESEEKFSGAFQYASIGVALVSPDGHWLKVNQALCALVGYSEAELLTRTFQEITHPDDLEADLEYMRQLLAGEIRSYQMEKRYVHARGHLVTILLNVSLVRDGQGQPCYFISQIQDITERKKTEESLRLLNSAVEQSKESILITDAQLDLPGPKIIFANPAFTQMTGYPAAEAIGKTPRILQGPLTDKTVLSRLRQNLERGEAFTGEAINYRKDGKEFNLEWQIAPLRNAAGKITHYVAIQHDITGRKRLEAQLFQSQKLETVGKLAGGFAHEFNSILTAIIGQSELLLGDLPAGSPLTKNATEISKAAGRAAKLTRQLLAYGRKQFLQPTALDLNRIIASMEGMFQHLMSGNVDVRIVSAADLHAMKADAGQMEQVIMNMVINARDAMPNGGKLMLETANITFDEQSVGRYPELKPGDYVMLAISDSGTGMSEEVKARVFEPFFSTKSVGQGTGLGLSTCYGIIKQSGGHISVYSEQGRGTTFKIYLPQVEVSAQISAPRLDSPDLPGGTETILLVEDDPALREMAATLLRRLGYTVLTAGNGVEALSVQHERSTGHVDLLFTDVVMPYMSGKELADRVRALYPDTKILFTSAYTENAIVHQGVLDKGVALLQKPFTPSALAHKLREVLDQPVAPKLDGAQETFRFTKNPGGGKIP